MNVVSKENTNRVEKEQSVKPIIRCRDVWLGYGRNDVVRGVTMDVPAGVFMPFIGPNGAGKSTLLRGILGLLRPRKGVIDTPFKTQPPGYVPQQKMLDPLFPVSVRQVVTMGAYPRLGFWRRPKGGHRERIDKALERFDLAEHQHKTYAQLSGGMRQKALVARAFVSNADVYVMDEPTSELDEHSEAEVLDHLYKLCRQDGATVLIAHHGQDRITTFADTVCFMEHGRARMEKR